MNSGPIGGLASAPLRAKTPRVWSGANGAIVISVPASSVPSNPTTPVFRWIGGTYPVLTINGGITTVNGSVNAAYDLGLGYNRTIIWGGTGTLATISDGIFKFTNAAYVLTALLGGVQALSGAGAINLTTASTAYTSTGAAEVLTLADGTPGQRKTICHVVKGTLGTGVLTPTTKSGYTSITFNNAGDSVDLQFFTTAGWCIVGSFGVVIA